MITKRPIILSKLPKQDFVLILYTLLLEHKTDHAC